MTDPVYALLFTALVTALGTALLIPAPAGPAADDDDDEARIQVALLGAGCAATVAMGILALAGRPAESTVCGAIAWLLVMPCVWLARAPRPAGEWGDEEEDDDGGGSPPPHAPSAPPAPDDRLPGLQPPTVPAAPPARAAPQPAPVMATAAKVQRLLAAQEAERLAAAREVERLLAAAALIALSQPERADAGAEPPTPAAPPPAPVHATQRRRLSPAPRVRADHRSIVHVLAALAHADRRRRTTATRRAASAQPRSALHD